MAYEMLCHKCFEDYIKICQAHPPPDPDDAIAAFSRSLPQVPPTDGPAVIRDNTINNGDEEEQHKPAAEEEDEQEEDAPADEQELYLLGITPSAGRRCIPLSCIKWMLKRG
jgi:hypothetical protein